MGESRTFNFILPQLEPGIYGSILFLLLKVFCFVLPGKFFCFSRLFLFCLAMLMFCLAMFLAMCETDGEFPEEFQGYFCFFSTKVFVFFKAVFCFAWQCFAFPGNV